MATISVTLTVVRAESAVHQTITPGNWTQVGFGCRGLARARARGAYGPGSWPLASLTMDYLNYTTMVLPQILCLHS